VRNVKRNLLYGTVLISALLNIAASPRRLITRDEVIDLKNEKFLETKIDFGAGELKLLPNAGSGKLFEGRLAYRPNHGQPDLHYSAGGQTGYLTLETHSLKKIFSDGDPKNQWDISFSPKVSHSFDIDIGACEAEMDFTGLPIEKLKLDLGAGEGRVRFDRPNPVVMEMLDIDAGASELEIKGLGNARFKKLKFDGGMGSFRLDFSGQTAMDGQAEISIGMGEVEIVLPRELGVRVYKEGALSSIDFDGDLEKVGDGVWETENYRTAKRRLIIDLSVGLGSAEVRRAER